MEGKLEIMSARLPWQRILIRSGFSITERDGKIVLENETESNREYLQKILDLGQFGILDDEVFLPNEEDVDEALWLGVVNACHGEAEGGSAENLRIMDTYMAGLMRWINQIGISTTLSCDGLRQGRRNPHFTAKDVEEARLALWILNSEKRFFSQHNSTARFVRTIRSADRSAQTVDRQQLLNLAEWLYENKTELSELLRVMRRIDPPSADTNRPTRPSRDSEVTRDPK